MVEERPQSLGGISLQILACLETGLHIGIQVILEPAVGRQGRAVLVGAVVVTREAVAFRTAVKVVQMGGDFRRAEPHVVLRQLVMDAADQRAPVACKKGRAGHGLVRSAGLVAPYPLWWVGRAVDPVIALDGTDLVKQRARRKLRPALMRVAPRLTGHDVGGFGGRRTERRHRSHRIHQGR
ncbi:hypothetical protein D3C72_1638160 [compost metagenome]